MIKAARSNVKLDQFRKAEAIAGQTLRYRQRTNSDRSSSQDRLPTVRLRDRNKHEACAPSSGKNDQPEGVLVAEIEPNQYARCYEFVRAS